MLIKYTRLARLFQAHPLMPRIDDYDEIDRRQTKQRDEEHQTRPHSS